VSREDALADQLRIDYREAQLSNRERAMLDYVVKLTRTPWAMRQGDVEALRAVGFDDLGILHVVLLASFFNYINRVADALGVTVNPGMWERAERHGPIPWEAESGSGRPATGATT
jgi:uncharacterized peroxidase-related enzyme